MNLPGHNYIAVDPGETTGWALLSLAGGFKAGEQPYAVAIDTISEAVTSLAILNSPIRIACERAYASRKDLQGGALANLEWEMETIGCLKWIARKGQLIPVKIISQADSKSFGTRELLQTIGWWTEGHPHANDAARVLARWVSEVDPLFWKPFVRQSGIFDGHG